MPLVSSAPTTDPSSPAQAHPTNDEATERTGTSHGLLANITRPGGPVPTGALSTEALAERLRLPDLETRLDAVDDRIQAALNGNEALLGPASLRVAIGGGKRLRPLLTIACAAVSDTFDDRVVSAAAAIELVQVGSLVHDDILDEATTRRGQPTINATEGLGHAVLAGDYMLARAAELAASVSREAADAIAAALGELCEGQVLELRDTFSPDRSVDAYLGSVRGKTAALFECACRLGAQCGGLSDASVNAMARFGHAFGMGFQLLDDILDLVGDASELGKPTGTDLRGGVYTLPVLHTLATPAHAAPLQEALEADELDLTAILDLIQQAGGIPATIAAMDRYVDAAHRAASHLNQTAVGEGLASFPHLYTTWALENLVDPKLLQVLTAL